MDKGFDFNRLFIFEIANNHMGSLTHGLKIIKEVAGVCKGFDFRFAFKLQYRDLDSFIHPDFKGNKEERYVRRFEETRLSEAELKALKDGICRQGFLAVCTPFDEPSVERVERHGFDIIKIASCSFTDWPLLERIALTDVPIIASTAGASIDELDQVVTFFEHRSKSLCIMHCVGEYPTKKGSLQLNQIDLLKNRYPGIAIGFSTHEEPDNLDAVKIAIAKGAKALERHVAVGTKEYPVNAYSSGPEQIRQWLKTAQEAYQMCGVEGERYAITEKERNDLRDLKRGVFVKTDLRQGEKLIKENIFYAIPCREGQLIAGDIAKYVEYTLKKPLRAGEPVNLAAVDVRNLRAKVMAILKELKEIILKSHIALPNKIDLELSHHYGIERYDEWGAAILNCINREYCKKLIILLPKQKHPFHHHIKKEETFQVLYGSMEVAMGEELLSLRAGDILTVERGTKHNFSSKDGVIFEEVSTTHYKDDSFYDDEKITNNSRDRKTELTFRSDWLYKAIR